MKSSLFFLIVHIFLITIVLALPIERSPSPTHRHDGYQADHEDNGRSRTHRQSSNNGYEADEEDNGKSRTHHQSLKEGSVDEISPPSSPRGRIHSLPVPKSHPDSLDDTDVGTLAMLIPPKNPTVVHPGPRPSSSHGKSPLPR